MTEEKPNQYEQAKKKIEESTKVSGVRQDVVRDFIVKGLLTEEIDKKTVLVKRDALVGRIMANNELSEREKVFCAVFASSLLEQEYQKDATKQMIKNVASQQMRLSAEQATQEKLRKKGIIN